MDKKQKTLVLRRIYFAEGTNGELFGPDKTEICKTIELVWKDNEPRKSCIPEGRYRLQKRYSQKFADHLILEDVPNRSLILIHPANNAEKELLGCIAPVTKITGVGKGDSSRVQFNKVNKMVRDWIDQGYEVYLEIHKK